MRNVLIASLIVSFIPLLGCDSAPKVSDREIDPIESAELSSLLRGKDKVVLVDCRKPEVFEQGHAEGAVNIQIQDARSSDPRLTDAKHLIVYGNDWQDDLPRVMAKRLHIFGYSNIRLYTAGYAGYKKDILGITDDQPK